MADQPTSAAGELAGAEPVLSAADVEEEARKRHLLVAILNSSRPWWYYEENPVQLQNVPWGGSV